MSLRTAPSIQLADGNRRRSRINHARVDPDIKGPSKVVIAEFGVEFYRQLHAEGRSGGANAQVTWRPAQRRG